MIRPGAIGDFIVSLPALECLRAEYLEVWTASPNVPLVRFADRARSIASTGLDLLGVTEPPARLLEELRGFDSIVSWYGANRSEFRELVRALQLPFTFLSAIPPEGAGLHATEFYLLQVRAMANGASDGIPRIRCDVEREDFAAIHPFSGSAHKNWPLENFLALATHWRGSGRQILFGGGPSERAALEPARVAGFPVAAGTPLLVTAGLMKLSTVIVGADTGLLHLAVAMGRRVMMLMRFNAPGNTHPFRHADWTVMPPAGKSILEIPTTAVIEACARAFIGQEPG